MGIANKAFREGDVYIDFPFEDVMFHCFKGVGGRIMRKFYGGKESAALHTSDIFAQACLYGTQNYGGAVRGG